MKHSTALLLYNAPLLGADGSADSLAERGVLETVGAVAATLESQGWSVRQHGLSPVGVTSLLNCLASEKPDVVINLFEGFPGVMDHEALVAQLIEEVGIPYTGNGPEALEVCRRKELCSERLRLEGLPTPREWLARDGLESLPEEELLWPLILKPAWEDGSVGITKDSLVFSRPSLEERLLEARAGGNLGPILLQEYIAGREFAVSLIGPSPMTTLAISELDFSGLPSGSPAIVTAEAKWCSGSLAFNGIVPRCPADIAPGLEKSIREVAERAASVLGLRDYARVDIRVRDDRPVVIDVNPNPDLAPSAGFSRSAAVTGLDYDRLVMRLVEYARSRNHG